MRYAGGLRWMLVVVGCADHHVPESLAVDEAEAVAPVPVVVARPEVVREEVKEKTVSDSMRRELTAEDEANAGTFEGILDIDRASGGKGLQGTWLDVGGGRRFILSYRPMPEHFDKLEKRVVVRGIRYWPGGQHIDADHLRVVSIRLADGEVPYASPPTSLPPAPKVRTRAELVERVGRWVMVVGKVKAIRRGRDEWAEVELNLDDGTVVAWTEGRWIVDTYRARIGERMTILGELAREPGRFVLVRADACAGEVDECGFANSALR